MTLPHSPQVALVTGAGRRIGYAVARTLASAGYHVALHVNHSRAEAEKLAAELTAEGKQAIVLAADLSDPASVEQMFEAAWENFGRLDALVNCAAIWKARPLEQIEAADVREHFEINTLGTFLCCRTAGLNMAAQPTGGGIVNFGDWAIARPYRNYAAYFPSKGAIPALTRSLAVELAARNPRVRVNAILPGPVLLPADLGAEGRRRSIAGTLVKREGTAEEMADAVLFLLRNQFITGVCLPVDGGRSVFADSDDAPCE